MRIHYIYELENMLTNECVAEISQSGDNSTACENWLTNIDFCISRAAAIEELIGYGEWTRTELMRKNMGEIKGLLLWIAAWNVKEVRREMEDA